MNRSIPALLLVTVLALTVSCKKVSQDAQASVALPGTGTPPPTSSTRTAADAPAPTFATSSAAGDAVASNPSSIPQSPISEPAPAADDAAGSDYARTSYRPLEIPAGTPVSIRLQSSISSASASRGDRFHVSDLPTTIQNWRDQVEPVAEKAVPRRGIMPIAEMEKQAILGAIDLLHGDKLEAARLLGIGKTTLYRKLKEYGALQ